MTDRKTRGTYVYAVVAAPRRPRAAGRPKGLDGAGPVRLLELTVPPGRLRTRPSLKQWVAVADVPLARYGSERINARLTDIEWVSRAAVAHEAVVESFIGSRAVLPMKLFTIFTSDERAIAHLIARAGEINAVLKRVVAHDEWGVRVLVDGSASSTSVPATACAPASRKRRFVPCRQKAAAGRRGRGSGSRQPDGPGALREPCPPRHARPAAGCERAPGRALADGARCGVPREAQPRVQLPEPCRSRGATAERARLSDVADRPLAAVQLRERVTEVMPRKKPLARKVLPVDRVTSPPDATLLDVLDHVLTKGVIATGDVTLGVAGVDLIYLRLSALLCAVDRIMPPGPRERRRRRP